MTKAEEKACNKFFLHMIKHKNRRYVLSKKFNKKAPLGQLTVVLPMADILAGWRKFRKSVEGKKNGK